MSLEIQKDYNESMEFWHVKLSGDVDILTSNKLREEVNSLLDEKERSIAIDCQELTYIDSTGLGVLISLLKRVKGNGYDIEIANAQPNIAKLLKITGLDKIFILK